MMMAVDRLEMSPIADEVRNISLVGSTTTQRQQKRSAEAGREQQVRKNFEGKNMLNNF
jgi:hypothetical protein